MPQPLTANQVVAYNLMRARKMLGLSQTEAAQRLKPYLGALWSKTVYSTIERSYQGKRVRQFTADDLVAFSRAFELPVVYFFLPPRAEDRTVGAGEESDEVTGVGVGDSEVSWREMFEVMFGGTYRASLMHRMIELPKEDRPEPRTHEALALDAVQANRTSIWDPAPGPYTDDDPRLRVAHDGRDDE
jgi:hypothetical protein